MVNEMRKKKGGEYLMRDGGGTSWSTIVNTWSTERDF